MHRPNCSIKPNNFCALARIAVLVAGAPGFYIIHALDAWVGTAHHLLVDACDDCDLGAVSLARKPDVGRVSCDNVAHSTIAVGFAHRPSDNGVWRDLRFAQAEVRPGNTFSRHR